MRVSNPGMQEWAMGLSKSKIKKVNNFGIVGKVFKCRIQLFENFCHQRSQEVTRGQ